MTRQINPQRATLDQASVGTMPLDVLRRVFGYGSFRGEQEAIINHVMLGGQALVLMPTGGGKSLCYQIPALCRAGMGVIISPLIALMHDQVEALKQLGVRAAALHSGLENNAAVQVIEQARAGELQLLYIAPERLLMEGTLRLLDECQISLFAIDEAHCVSQWGHDFRPEYLQLAVLHKRFAQVPRLALTATADVPTRHEIISKLKLEDGRVFIASFDRPNIRYRVTPKAKARAQLLDFLEQDHHSESGIIYCLSRSRVEAIADWLREQGYNALPYHAGLDAKVRALHQDRFIKEDGVIMVATIAFGMGIDKPDVRFVVHMDLPKSIEAYYQETGRAGRDGLAAEALLLYGPEDAAKLRQFIENGEANDQRKRLEHRKLDNLLGYCDSPRCRRQTLLAYFEETLSEPCGNCDLCLHPPPTFDGTVAAQKALSAALRTGQQFGAAHLTDILVGADSERMRRFRHNLLPTYGVGKEFSRDQWRGIFRQLVVQGFLVTDMEGHGGLRLGDEALCRPVLRGAATVTLREDTVIARQAKMRDKRRDAATAPRSRARPEKPEDEMLFQALRTWRLELAKMQNVPPYVIFHDATLMALAQARPGTLQAMGKISGVGSVKLEKYGPAILDVIARHV